MQDREHEFTADTYEKLKEEYKHEIGIEVEDVNELLGEAIKRAIGILGEQLQNAVEQMKELLEHIEIVQAKREDRKRPEKSIKPRKEYRGNTQNIRYARNSLPGARNRKRNGQEA